jgi:hypothetical protein
MDQDDNSCDDSSSLLPFAVEPDLIELTDEVYDPGPVETYSNTVGRGSSPAQHVSSIINVLDPPNSTQKANFNSVSMQPIATALSQEQERNHFDSTSFILESSQDFFRIGDECAHSQHQNKNAITMMKSNYSRAEPNESLNFSKLMKEAEGDGTFIDETSKSSFYQELGSMGHKTNDYEHQVSRQPENTREAGINKLSSHSFHISVLLTTRNVSVREVMDVVSNPELLRFWDESIENLIVTDKKGGAAQPDISGPSDQEMTYQEPNIEDFDDNLIVPPAKVVETSDPAMQVNQTCKQRHHYDGEWIEASTSEIIPPASHTNIVDDCVRKTRTLFGFGQYGSVTMFIERNLNQVSFTVGPFRAGISLSHKIMIYEADSDSNGIVLVDEVKVVDPLNECDRQSICSCFDNIKDVWSEWFSPGIDGYINQSKNSLMNLADLILKRSGDEISAGHLILPGAYHADVLRTPLLQYS